MVPDTYMYLHVVHLCFSHEESSFTLFMQSKKLVFHCMTEIGMWHRVGVLCKCNEWHVHVHVHVHCILVVITGHTCMCLQVLVHVHHESVWPHATTPKPAQLTCDSLQDAGPVEHLRTARDGDRGDDLQVRDGAHQVDLVQLWLLLASGHLWVDVHTCTYLHVHDTGTYMYI